MKPLSFVTVSVTLLITVAASAQPCKSIYQLGETIPPGCQTSGSSPWRQWGEGYPGAATGTQPIQIGKELPVPDTTGADVRVIGGVRIITPR